MLRRYAPRRCVCAVLTVAASLTQVAVVAGADSAIDPADWVRRFSFWQPEVEADGLCPPSSAELPAFAVTPAATGRQLVRVSLPFAPGTFPAELGLAVLVGEQEIIPDLRVLTYHAGRPRSVRRAMVTFVHEFPSQAACPFRVALRRAPARTAHAATGPDAPAAADAGRLAGRIGTFEVSVAADAVEMKRSGKRLLRAEFIAPALASTPQPVVEVIEQGEHYLWARLFVPDRQWPRIIEVRADAAGTMAARGHLQRLQPGGDRPRAPEIGWRITGPSATTLEQGEKRTAIGPDAIVHGFSEGQSASIVAGDVCVDLPDAHLHKRGKLTVKNAAEASEAIYLRCEPAEQVPHQLAAWRTAAFVVRPVTVAPSTPLLEPPHRVTIAPEAFASIYDSRTGPDLSPWPVLAAVLQYHRDAIASCLLPGDDFGNVGSMPVGSVFGMNRLNHCPPIFEEYYRSGDARLRNVALQWCQNMHDLSLWWGTPEHFGGTRYNNMAAHNPEFRDDRTFMWRSDSAVDFCTKGVDTFQYAYEETGDPRMAVALRWQADYAGRQIRLQREMRNIGDVLDFLRLYRFTGKREYLNHALRLFRELREHLSPGDLFSQGGQPIVEDIHFIAEDAEGTKYPFAKPYIIGYALAGLPVLVDYQPDEPKLLDVVRAVARFLTTAQDAAGGWPYPHPRSPGVNMGQGMEHARQLIVAAACLEKRGEPIDHLLDAIERTLHARILAWQRSGQFLVGVGSWEEKAGLIKNVATWYELYKRPEDRDRSRDYSEGAVNLGSAPPEGVVYFPEVLAFYLAHRPAERLFHANEILGRVLDRIPKRTAAETAPQPSADYLRHGVAAFLPTFRDQAVARLAFPLRHDSARWPVFADWRREARVTLLRCLLTPPPRAEFAPAIVAREDRGSYEARKLVFNVSADCRVPAYLLVPKGKGPFPAVLALHDHGAFFLIGKEKVVRPFDERQAIIDAAADWAGKCYGGRFFGDELVKRGYVVFAADALFWGDRGRKEGVEYSAQQALSSNLLQMGMTWPGVITWDDIRSAEFVASLPEVDPKRIAAMGLSMGSHRTWMLCAASDRIAAGAAICWMGTTEVLMAAGNNQTKGHSSYSMLVPDLRNYLDYPDVASIACPKPMLFYNGTEDGLFPVKGVEDAYARMHRVWASQDADGRLTTKLWPRPHVFDAEMQDAAFAWLDGQLKNEP